MTNKKNAAAVMPQTFQELKEFYMDARSARTVTAHHISERVETREAECLKIWQESEESKQFPDAVQLIHHNPMYFMTRSNRFFQFMERKSVKRNFTRVVEITESSQ